NGALQRGISIFFEHSSELDREHDRANAQIDESAAGAEALVDAAAKDAKRSINGTAGAAHARVNTAFKSADGQIDKLLDEIVAPFKQTIADAKEACTTSGDAAVKAVNGWRTSFEKDLKLEGSAVTKARVEAKRKAAPKAITDAAALLTSQLAETKRTYEQTDTATSTQVRTN